jgi:thiol-disulfide isomerase/thioredoxin
MIKKAIGILAVISVSMFFLLDFAGTDAVANSNKEYKAGENVFKVLDAKPGTGKKAADFTFEMNGEQVKFSEYTKGKYVFLNVWGTWCGPCKKEIPDIIEIHKEMKEKGLVVMGIALETRTNDPISTVEKFSKDYKITYLNVAEIGRTSKINKAYGNIPAVPTTFIIDKDGNIVERIQGMRSKAQFMEAINRAMK